MPRTLARSLAVAALAVLTLLAGSGCQTPSHPYAILPGHEGAGSGQRLVVLPLNLVVSLPAELEKPSKRFAELLVDYLREAGNEVQVLHLSHARSGWMSAVANVKAASVEEPDFNAVADHFVAKLREAYEFDAVVMPDLVFRMADMYQGSSAVAWDGVKREMEVANQAHMKGSIYLMGGFYGKMNGVSLHLYIFDATGMRFFESYGGLDLVHFADVEDAESKPRYEMKLKPNPLANEVVLNEGIGVAFDPYVTDPGR